MHRGPVQLSVNSRDKGKHTTNLTSNLLALPPNVTRPAFKTVLPFRVKVTMASQMNGHDARRPSAASRFPTAPSVMTMNGHFAAVGDAPTKEQYEHGIQVIDEEKEFKYASLC